MSSIALAAGGTGGHLFAAIAVGQEIMREGLAKPILITDLERFPKQDGLERVLIPEMSLKGSPLKVVMSGFEASVQVVRLISLYKEFNTKVVIGFGGYTSFTPCIAARLCGIPVILHEQNSVLGKANRVMARFAKAISLGFPAHAPLPKHISNKCFLTRNPIREGFTKTICLAPSEYFSILVIGGSQGANIFSSIVPKAMKEVRKRYPDKKIKISHQCADPGEQLKGEYKKLNLTFETEQFFSDMPRKYAEADLVISRAGASTLEEVVQTCKPALLIPLPIAANNHQELNARYLSSKGASWCISQNDSCYLEVASTIIEILDKPELLRKAAINLQALHSRESLTLLNLIKDIAL